MHAIKHACAFAILASTCILPFSKNAYAKQEDLRFETASPNTVDISLTDAGLNAQYSLADAREAIVLSPEQGRVRETNWSLPEEFELKNNQIRRTDGTSFSNVTIFVKPDAQKLGRAYPGLIRDANGNTQFNLGYFLPSDQSFEIHLRHAENLVAIDGNCDDFSSRAMRGPENRLKVLNLYITDQSKLLRDHATCVAAPNLQLRQKLRSTLAIYQAMISGTLKQKRATVVLMEDVAQVNGGNVGDVDDLGFVSLRYQASTIENFDYEALHIFVHELGHVFEKFRDHDDFGIDAKKRGWLQEGFAEFLALRFLEQEGYAFKSTLETHINDCHSLSGQNVWADLNRSSEKAFYSCGGLTYLLADTMLRDTDTSSSVTDEYRNILETSEAGPPNLYDRIFEAEKYEALGGASLREYLEKTPKEDFWRFFDRYLLKDKYLVARERETNQAIITNAWISPMLAGLCPAQPVGFWTAQSGWTLDLPERCNAELSGLEINQVNGFNFLIDPWKAYEAVVAACSQNLELHLGHTARTASIAASCNFNPEPVQERIVLTQLEN